MKQSISWPLKNGDKIPSNQCKSSAVENSWNSSFVRSKTLCENNDSVDLRRKAKITVKSMWESPSSKMIQLALKLGRIMANCCQIYARKCQSSAIEIAVEVVDEVLVTHQKQTKLPTKSKICFSTQAWVFRGFAIYPLKNVERF